MDSPREEHDHMQVMIELREQPVKGESITMTSDEVRAQAERGRDCMEAYDEDTRGTCVDERFRVGLLSGEKRIEARPSVPGGPDVYGLYVGELAGLYDDEALSGEERLRISKQRNNAKAIKSGGHAKCAANKSFDDIVGIIAANPEAASAYAQAEMGEEYNPKAMSEVVDNAKRTKASGRYGDWDEDVYLRVLGDEAGEAIEQLGDVPHEGRTLIRTKVPGKAINQTKLHERAGEDSFENTEDYAERIEKAQTHGMSEWAATLARHAREAVLAGVAAGVPNPELQQARVYL